MRKKSLRGFIYALLASVLSGCCFVDYTEDVQEFGKLYIDALIAFEKKYQHYPDYDEIEKFRGDFGCIRLSYLEGGYNCSGIEYQFRGGIEYASDEEVVFDIVKSSTNCRFSFQKTKGGKITFGVTECWDSPCFRYEH